MMPFADIHCHPSFKSYGHSFPSKQNSPDIKEKSSIFYYDPPGLTDKLIDLLGGIVKYRQSDMSSLGFGNTGIICASLYPLEKGFFNNKLGTGAENDVLLNFITSVGAQRVNFVQGVTDYFADLVDEYNYYKDLNNQSFKLADNQEYKYIIAKNATDVDIIVNGDVTANKRANTIAVVLTIEGGHCFGTGIDPLNHRALPEKVLANVDAVKNWEHRPLFITLTHHFYNEICGHAKSLTGIVEKVTDQSFGMGSGITKMGKEVIRLMLDNTHGKRIYIDIKHMSRKSRLEYFEMLDTEFATEEIPVVASHGAVTGNAEDGNLFLNEDINFFDDELVRIAKTNGLLGLQLDERRITAPHSFNLRKSHSLERRKVLYYSSYMLWLQMKHIAELLDSMGMFAWGIQSIGSDYDGVVNPINGYWTAENLPTLEDYLLKHAFNYMCGDGKKKLKEFNRLDPEEIVSRMMGGNAYRFIMKYYK
jgi:microsomal dipeptidase-like Zn-dependent dipeptidase